MDWIKYYSKYDMTCDMYIRKIIKIANRYEDNYFDEENINKILEYLNIIKFCSVEEIKNIITIETEGKIENVLKSIKMRIGQFISSSKTGNFLSLIEDVELSYKEDYWEFVEKYNIYECIDKSDFELFLKDTSFHFFVILKFKKTVNYFDEILRKHMLEVDTSAEVLLHKYFYKENGKGEVAYLPPSLNENDVERIILNFIESSLPNINQLEMIINYPSNSELRITDRLKLKAKRRYNSEVDKIFDSNSGFEMGVTIKYAPNQVEAVIYNHNGLVSECSVSRSWIEDNLDFNTLWNNFIYIFEFFDKQMRLNLVSKSSEIGTIEGLTRINSKFLYNNFSSFKHKDMMSIVQINSYVHILTTYQIRLENMIEWFFVEYLVQEFEISNFIVNMPTNASSNFEKCRAILPEIDRILKQYRLFLEDGAIDQELLQVSSSHIFFKDCKSCVDKKYVYPLKGIFDSASFLLFSDQSTIFYLPKIKDKYKNFYQLLLNENIKLNDFQDYQINRINWLIENHFIYEDNDGYMKFKNKNRIILFADLYYNEVISYWNCNSKLREEIDILIREEVLISDSKLFTEGEQDYLDYHLNKSKFSNSLDLRNSYLHGTHTNDDEMHRINYLVFLKLIVIIIVKINDDLSIREKSLGELVKN